MYIHKLYFKYKKNFPHYIVEFMNERLLYSIKGSQYGGASWSEIFWCKLFGAISIGKIKLFVEWLHEFSPYFSMKLKIQQGTEFIQKHSPHFLSDFFSNTSQFILVHFSCRVKVLYVNCESSAAMGNNQGNNWSHSDNSLKFLQWKIEKG